MPTSPTRGFLAPCARVTVLVALLAPALAALAEPGSAGPGRSTPPGRAPAPLRVTTAVVESRSVERRVATVGHLLAWEEAVVRAAVPGTVVRLHAARGDRIEAGRPLAELDPPATDLPAAELAAAQERLARARAAADRSRASLAGVREGHRALVADLERARTDAEWRRRELERHQALHARELIAARDVDQARAEHQAAAALVRVAEGALARHADEARAAQALAAADLGAIAAAEAEMRQGEAAVALGRARRPATIVPAPRAGVVTERHVAVGEAVPEDAPLFTVSPLDPLKYSGTVAARAAAELRPGQEVRLAVEGFQSRTFRGRLTRVARAGGGTTLALEARLPNRQGLLEPGLAARGAVLGQAARASVVPVAALAAAAGGARVFVLVDGRARERRVKVGRREAGWVEILAGVKPGETVATSALAQLYDGAPVAPVTEGAAPGVAAAIGS